MTGYVGLIAGLIPETLREPRRAARRLMDLGLPDEARWIGLLLVVVLAVMESRIAYALLPPVAGPDYFALLADPWVSLPAQTLALVLVAGAIAWIGGLFGGRGTFRDALLLVVWVEFVMTVAQAVQLVVLIILPPFGSLLALGVLLGFVWVMAQVIAELHGSRNIFKVLLGMVAGFALVVTVLAVLLSALGLIPTN